MGQKVYPTGFRLGITENWRSRWFADKNYAETLGNDLEIRKYLKKRLSRAAVSRVEIERAGDKVKIIIFTARPGIVIGKKGAEIDTLRHDLEKVVTEGRPSHFFGSVVSSTEGSEKIIIDGQQRLTTVSLLLLALSTLAKAGEIPCESSTLADKIMFDYLVDQWQPEEKKVKLKPVKNDQHAFTRLFGDVKDFILDSTVTQNYLYFRDRLRACDLSADDVFGALRKLVIIDITLESGDNPQLIFESLNSTGLDLSEADKVRNYVLMGLPHAMQGM